MDTTKHETTPTPNWADKIWKRLIYMDSSNGGPCWLVLRTKNPLMLALRLDEVLNRDPNRPYIIQQDFVPQARPAIFRWSTGDNKSSWFSQWFQPKQDYVGVCLGFNEIGKVNILPRRENGITITEEELMQDNV